VCARPIVGLAIWLAAKLIVGCTASAVGVIDCARVLQAVYKVLIV